jgi:hypothetical protein
MYAIFFGEDRGSLTGIPFMMGGRIHTPWKRMVEHTCLLPIEDKKVKEEASTSILLMGWKELLKKVKKEQEMQFVVVRKPRGNKYFNG